MGIFKKAVYSKVDVFVKFKMSNFKKNGFLLFGLQGPYALSSKSGWEPCNFAPFWGDLRWNDPIINYSYFYPVMIHL